MRKLISSLIGIIVLFLILSSSILASGTALMLGAGQQFRFDLPLDTNKSYEVSMALRTDLENASVIMILCEIQNNNEIIEHHSSLHELGDQGAWQILSIPEINTATNVGRFELIISSNLEGRYFWKDLKVERSFQAANDAQQYWSTKLASEGTFFTGLVIDARHLDVKRGMSPRIYSESGQLLYGGVLAADELVQKIGVVGYGSELTSELLERITVDADYPYVAPLVVEALATADAAKTGVYISEEDTRRVLEAMVKYDFFARYSVIFLVN